MQVAAVVPAQLPPVQLYDVGEFVQVAVNTDVPPDATLDGLAVSVQTGAEDCTPLPVTITAFGLPVPLLATEIELTVDTASLGVYVTPSVHDAPAATLPAQLLVTPYTLLLLAMLEMVSVVAPVLVSVTVFAALVLPTAWLAKVSDVGLRDTAG